MRSTLILLVLLLATPALASDGIHELNQTCAVQTGCIDNSGGIGDGPGFPINIEIPGSYILTSNLVVSGVNTSGLFIAAAPVTIDLNGFEIQGAVNCTGFGSTLTCDAGTGRGIQSSFVRTTVMNGNVIKFGSDGIQLGGRSRIERVLVERNGGNGIDVGSDSIVTDCRAYRNGNNGIETSESSIVETSTSASNRTSGFRMTTGAVISSSAARDNGLDGIAVGSGSLVSDNTTFENENRGISAGTDSTISGNTASANGIDGILTGGGVIVVGNTANGNQLDGINVAAGSNVQQNTVRQNGGYGLSLCIDCAYRANVVTANTTGAVDGSGVNLGDNYCAGTGVVSSSCP